MKRSILIVIALAVIAFVIWQMGRQKPPAGTADRRSIATPSITGGAQTPSPKAQPQTASADRSTLADALNSPSTDIQADLRLVDEIIGTFRTNFPHDGNPVGDNAEVTAALSGKNQLQFAFIPPDHPAINRAGELCDRWGTPFFFHAESGTHMDIRSAGPDKKLFTADDIVFSPK